MDGSIARIAGKPVTLESPTQTRVSAETKRATLRLPADARLVGAVTGTVEHFAQEAGLDERVQKELMSAAEQACLDTFQLVDSPAALIDVAVEEFPDRLEIRISHSGDSAPAIGLDAFVGAPGSGNPSAGAGLMGLVDRVQYDTEGSVSRLRLIKYLAKGGSNSR